ncbi:aldehyde dehydrogenase family 7 member A1-like isoform X2 [Rosa rugosa]|uniref:aldehyde dehydrogenase family 7 member A1-like isoform X2 n=1 Tax=Rosa rugosa TaxID=74645 RepID=UPI002B407F40|nr:aldehyde dehydrogenase family 7 member A1-like isoform X2 [Rosa rugosa]
MQRRFNFPHAQTLQFFSLSSRFNSEKKTEFMGKIVLATENPGGFINGKWKAIGPVISTFNPADNQEIAKVTEVSIEDYEEGICACCEASKLWKSTKLTRKRAFFCYVFIPNLWSCQSFCLS